MAGDAVTFRLDGELTIESVLDAFARFRDVLKALEQDQGASVRWVLAGLDYGSAGVTARAEPLDVASAAKISSMTDRFLAAGRQVSRATSIRGGHASGSSKTSPRSRARRIG